MLKTVKGKVIAGTIAVTLFAGAGAAFGASNAGERLETWFNNQFNIATAQVETDAKGYINSKKSELIGEYNVLKSNASGTINTTENEERVGAEGNIEKGLQDQITSINDKKIELEGYAKEEFGKILDDAEQEIYDLGTEASRLANHGMGKHTTKVGKEALATLEKGLVAKTDQAKLDLQAVIKTAQTNLQKEIDDQEEYTTDEIKKLIDKRIIEVRQFVTMMTNYMVQEQTDAIEILAQDLEEDALADLQKIVDGI